MRTDKVDSYFNNTLHSIYIFYIQYPQIDIDPLYCLTRLITLFQPITYICYMYSKCAPPWQCSMVCAEKVKPGYGSEHTKIKSIKTEFNPSKSFRKPNWQNWLKSWYSILNETRFTKTQYHWGLNESLQFPALSGCNQCLKPCRYSRYSINWESCSRFSLLYSVCSSLITCSGL